MVEQVGVRLDNAMWEAGLIEGPLQLGRDIRIGLSLVTSAGGEYDEERGKWKGMEVW